MSRLEQTMVELDEKLDEVDALIAQLPFNSAIKKQLSAQIYELYAAVEEQAELESTDWE